MQSQMVIPMQFLWDAGRAEVFYRTEIFEQFGVEADQIET